MSDWTSGYVAEVDYTHDFFQEMTPAVMALAATSKGQKHNLTQVLSYYQPSMHLIYVQNEH